MSPSTPKSSKTPGRDPHLTTYPTKGAKTMRSGTLFLLVAVDVIVAVLMLGSCVAFLVKPDPSVRAGPMYVTLALMTICALLMAFMAVNLTFFPLLPRRQTPNATLVMAATGATGAITGILTLGGAVSPLVMRLLIGTIAYVFISVQASRLERARAVAPAGNAASSAPRAQSPAKSRQRRGGRKR